MTMKPQPRQNGLTGEFYAFFDAGEVRMQRCGECGTWRHLPRHLCAGCHSDKWSWEPISGEGELLSWTTTMRPLHPAFTDVPMTLATVTLAEGPRMIAPIAFADGVVPVAGLKVRVEIYPNGEGHALPTFVSSQT
jgi:uncharacterized OB-fold protein